MRRRQLLAVLGTVGVAGCGSRFSGSESESTDLTPAPVPEARTSTMTQANGNCPLVPAEAELYHCPPQHANNRLQVLANPRVYNAGTGGIEFTLQNDSTLPFHTGRYRWTVAEEGANSWSVIDRGTGIDRLFINPGESFTWTLNGGSVVSGEAVSVAVGGGRHAFAVTGAVPRGRLTAVVSPFVVRPTVG